MTTECCWHFDLKLYCVPWSQEKMKEIEKLMINQAQYKYKDDHGKEYSFWKGVLTLLDFNSLLQPWPSLIH